MKKQIEALLSFKAFKPTITDDSYPLKSRVGGLSVAFVNYGALSCDVVNGSYSNGLELNNHRSFEVFGDDVLEYMRVCSPERLVALSWGGKVGVSLEKGAATNPWGHNRECVLSNEQSVIREAAKEEELLAFEGKLLKEGFTIVRTGLSTINLLNHMLGVFPNTNVPSTHKLIILILNQGYLTALDYTGGEWNHLRHRFFQILPMEDSSSSDENEEIEDFFHDMIGDTQPHLTKFVYIETSSSRGRVESVRKRCRFLDGANFEEFQSTQLNTNHPELEILAHD